MADSSGKKRIDSAARMIKASPQTIYQAFTDPKTWVSWLPPEGMSGQIDTFDAREGGTYRMVLTYIGTDHANLGKSLAGTDIVQGKFLALVPNKKIVQCFEFESDDPVYGGQMRMTWTLTALAEGTEVAVDCEDVPEGIRQEDHEAGLRSTLENLAVFTE
ncbi:Activator of Hsp90 ATPase homolog 1-like protein [Paenibacillus sp. cl141a]|uniref:SRPBCC domain-containing protein n=1 Tax=Paenibacillus sp. cl141a TaxID=1761877 RepID=UPI0008AF595C|nr:SRPBCC domain-containing protein [Paenibacillus sp. cl141a]SEM74235.1 Activator of Hsp90 ATPase homolog 1-like protein [Paenibacillus sp. cl141a]